MLEVDLFVSWIPVEIRPPLTNVGFLLGGNGEGRRQAKINTPPTLGFCANVGFLRQRWFSCMGLSALNVKVGSEGRNRTNYENHLISWVEDACGHHLFIVPMSKIA